MKCLSQWFTRPRPPEWLHLGLITRIDVTVIMLFKAPVLRIYFDRIRLWFYFFGFLVYNDFCTSRCFHSWCCLNFLGGRLWWLWLMPLFEFHTFFNNNFCLGNVRVTFHPRSDSALEKLILRRPKHQLSAMLFLGVSHKFRFRRGTKSHSCSDKHRCQKSWRCSTEAASLFVLFTGLDPCYCRLNY